MFELNNSFISATPIADMKIICNEVLNYGKKIEYIAMYEYKLKQMLITKEVNDLIKRPNLRKINKHFKKIGLPKIIIWKDL